MSLEKKVDNIGHKPFTILGFPRSGTNFLSSILATHPEVTLLVEPFSMHNGYIKSNFFLPWFPESYNSANFHSGMERYRTTIDYFNDFRIWINSGDREIRGFKETTFLMKLGWLQMYLPNLDIIYLERNPKGVVSSFKKEGLFERWNYQDIFYRLVDEMVQCQKLEQYRQLVRETDSANWIDVLTTMYIVSTSEVKRNLSLFRHTNVKYERLANIPLLSFVEIFDFLGLKINELVRKEIEERCLERRGGTFSTYRNSKETAQQYQYLLTPIEMGLINRKMERQGL